MRKSATTKSSLCIKQPQEQKQITHNLESSKSQKYLLEFTNQKKEDQENLYKFLKNNYIKFDKNMPQRIYEAEITLKNVEQKDIINMSKETIIPYFPPEISPEKLEKHKQSSKIKQNFTLNMYGEKVYDEGVLKRLTKSPSTCDRWKIKGLEQLQKEFDQKKQKSKLEMNLKNMPSNNISPLPSQREIQDGQTNGMHKRSVSFKMIDEINNYVTFNANQPQDMYDSFEQLQQSIHQKQIQKSQSQMNIQDEFQFTNNSQNQTYKTDQQNSIMRSSIHLQQSIRHGSYIGQDQLARESDDSFYGDNNSFNQKLFESFYLYPKDKSKPSTQTLIQPHPPTVTFSPLKGNIFSDSESRKSTSIPKKIIKNNNDGNLSYIMKVQKEKEEWTKNNNKSITKTSLKSIQSKVHQYIHSVKPKNIINQNQKQNYFYDQNNIFFDNSKVQSPPKPIPKKIDKNKNNQSLNTTQSGIKKGSIYSRENENDSKYNSIERSLKLSKALDRSSQKQFQVLQKYNDNFKIKSGLQFHKYCLVGQEDQEEKRVKENKNSLTKSQILQKYDNISKSQLKKPSLLEWELDEDEISELDFNEELTPQNFNKFVEQYHKWWFDLDETQKMHYFSSEELLKYYKDVKKTTKKQLYSFLKYKRQKRVN